MLMRFVVEEICEDAMDEPYEHEIQQTGYQDTEYQDTEYQDAEYQNTEYQNTEYQDTEYQNTEYQDTEYQDTEYQDTWSKVEEGQQAVEVQQFQENYKQQKRTPKKRESSFCLNMEFGKCGGKVSCKGMNSNKCHQHLKFFGVFFKFVNG